MGRPVSVLGDTTCKGCRRLMRNAETCTDERYPYMLDGEVRWLEVLRYGDPREFWGSPPESDCTGCGVKLGALHHWLCDRATCPNCGTRLVDCGCDMRAETEL